jgi:precorrin-2 methylase
VEDDERTGRPVTMKTDENMEKLRALVRTDRRLGIRVLAKELNMDKQRVRKILTKDLNTKKSA